MRSGIIPIPLFLATPTACIETTEPRTVACGNLLLRDTRPAGDTLTAGGAATLELRLGEGAGTTVGHTVGVHYTGHLEDGTRFDSSCSRQPPFSSAIGADQVIDGFDQGGRGRLPGGVRRLVIPADLAYGDEPRTGRPAGTLVFDAELLGIRGR